MSRNGVQECSKVSRSINGSAERNQSAAGWAQASGAGSQSDRHGSLEAGTVPGSTPADKSMLLQQGQIWADMSEQAAGLADLCVHTMLALAVHDIECALHCLRTAGTLQTSCSAACYSTRLLLLWTQCVT